MPKASKSPDNPQRLCWGSICKRPASTYAGAGSSVLPTGTGYAAMHARCTADEQCSL